jgi:dienelactone hydrolase
MASLIPGFEYDIFISYRQKDNKYDGWVTEFVDNLKHELESMFKDEVSVYFDINPHDGLLETYDVDASLKEKLKCLVCIPIISRTYCDPKSFAWEHEFKTFIDQVSQDIYGLKIKLPNGNVANRVLPVRIHDLDNADIKLFESTIGGILRSIDFVYKETGVNRQLRAKDDDIIKSSGHVLYRDQINKVALSTKEIIESMMTLCTLDKEKERQPVESRVVKSLYPDEQDITETVKEDKKLISGTLNPVGKGKIVTLLKRSKIFIPVLILIIAVFAVLNILFNYRNKVKLVSTNTIPEIERYITERNYYAAFTLLQKSEKFISKSPEYSDLVSRVITKMTILSDPPGADVYIREYSDTSGQWKNLGKTPIDSTPMPNVSYYTTGFTAFVVRFEKEGYENTLAVTFTKPDTLFRKLNRSGTIPDGMIYVEGYKEEVASRFLEEKNGFFIDKHEVTNKHYKDFIDKGGYENPEYWKNSFLRDGKTLTWQEAISVFIDKTGRPGPSTWEAGGYPEGCDDYPVTGISWYEAAAYAEFAGKELPTSYHWGSAAGFYIPRLTTYFASKIIPLSNFKWNGPVQVGKFPGINSFGAFDMAGNVREWCLNETKAGRIVRGGAWDEVSYMYSDLSQLPSFNRSNKNGFRCVKYINRERIPVLDFESMIFTEPRNYYKEHPVPENIYRIYRDQFKYDSTALNPVIENRDESSDDFIIEEITFNSAYGDEREIVYLFLPKKVIPPFQTIVFFPGSASEREDNLLTSEYTKWYVHFLVKNGRAVIFPVYKGTFERKIPPFTDVLSHQYTEYYIQIIKELSRSIDYLETRKDIDISRLGYYGVSWGGRLGSIIPAVEDRLKMSILIKGGFPSNRLKPGIDNINYVSRIKIPVLMLNGKYDVTFPLETNVQLMFDLLGTPSKDKRLCVYESDHNLPRDGMIKETLNWLDKYFGNVNKLQSK